MNEDEGVPSGTPLTPTERVTFDIVQRQQGLWWWYDLMGTIDGATERVGRDGGEPEDMNLHRDLKWVKPALERFYALGVEHGRSPDPVRPPEPEATESPTVASVSASGPMVSPIVHRDASGRCTIDWQTVDGEMVPGSVLLITAELVAECVAQINEAIDLRAEIAALRVGGAAERAADGVIEPSKLLEQMNQSLDGQLVTIYTEEFGEEHGRWKAIRPAPESHGNVRVGEPMFDLCDENDGHLIMRTFVVSIDRVVKR